MAGCQQRSDGKTASQYRAYDDRGRLVSQKNAQGHETRYEYSIAGDLM
ncbi:hypothetical protein ACMFUB_004744, partial [Citrobacter amalonaticus]